MCKNSLYVYSKFVNNFWIRAALYNSLPQNEDIDITIEETNDLIYQSEILQNKLLIIEDPMVCTNFTSVLSKVM